MTNAITYALFLILLLALAYVAWLAWKSYRGPAVKRGRGKRIGVVEAHNIGKERQLLLLRRDDVEHLVLIGGENDLVIETGIEEEAEAVMPPRAHAAPPMAPRRPSAPPAPPAPEASAESYEEDDYAEPAPFVPGPPPEQRIPPLPPRRAPETEY